MTSAYDPTGFSLEVTEDYTWRVREISDLKQIINISGNAYSPVARKAALALLYAHWEGHVQFVAEAYLKYVAIRKPKFSSLVSSFQAVKLSSSIKAWQEQKDSIVLRLKIIDTIRDMESEQFKSVPKGSIETGGNLNYIRFSYICEIMKIDAERIVGDTEFLDNNLVGTRNRIAHGDYVSVTEEQLNRLIDYVLNIMRMFRTEVENCVVMQTYMRNESTG